MKLPNPDCSFYVTWVNLLLMKHKLVNFDVIVIVIIHWTYDALRDLMQLDNLKTMRNNHGELLVLVKFEALVCNFTKSMTPPLVFFTSFLNCANRT